MRAVGFAILGFVGTYIMFFVFRWWPTMHDDTSGSPPSRIRRVQFICAVIAAAMAAIASLAFA
jgi:hypothetical protein